jgi:hypothetical protein
MIQNLPLEKITPLHEPKPDARKRLTNLIASMTSRGWDGRPLAVLQFADGYRAITGSHRYEAARQIGLTQIPCVVGDGVKLTVAGFEFESLRIVCDQKRIPILKAAGLSEIAGEIKREIDENAMDRDKESRG